MGRTRNAVGPQGSRRFKSSTFRLRFSEANLRRDKVRHKKLLLIFLDVPQKAEVLKSILYLNVTFHGRGVAA